MKNAPFLWMQRTVKICNIHSAITSTQKTQSSKLLVPPEIVEFINWCITSDQQRKMIILQKKSTKAVNFLQLTFKHYVILTPSNPKHTICTALAVVFRLKNIVTFGGWKIERLLTNYSEKCNPYNNI